MPDLISKFKPAWWLPGPHLPTIWGKMVRRRAPVHDRLERITTPDGDHVTLVRMGTITEGVPHLFILHGLEGKITAKYAHGMLAEARKLGWSGDMLMFRTCDGEINSTRRFYHSGETTDLDFVIRHLIEQHPHIELAMCGVSLGGNVLLKWLGEQGTNVPSQVRRAAAASVPFDLEAGARLMENGFARVYVRHFLATLVEKTARKIELFPDLCDLERLRAARTFFEFDDLLTGPVHGFLGAHDYYDSFPVRHHDSNAPHERLERSVPAAVRVDRGAKDRDTKFQPASRVSCDRWSCGVGDRTTVVTAILHGRACSGVAGERQIAIPQVVMVMVWRPLTPCRPLLR